MVRSMVRNPGAGMKGLRQLGSACAALLLVAAVARAQDDASPVRDVVSIQERPGFVEAVQQIATGKEREGIAALAKILAQFPDDPDRYRLHYNVACGHARLSELDAAFTELADAITRGYAIHPLQLENLGSDPDLASLRGDARYAALLARAKSQSEATRDQWEQLISPFSWLPPELPAPAEQKPLPLLIVLHPFGAEREAWARAHLLPFCEQHRFALFAPSGGSMIAPGRFAWAMADGDFLEGFRKDQRRVFFQLEELRKRAAIDPQRIYVTGAGQGAALGFAIALRNPQWARGAVLFGGGYAPATLRDWTERSAGFGRRVALVHGEADPLYPVAPLSSFAAALKEKGLAVELFVTPGGHDFAEAAIAAQLETRIEWIDEVPFAKANQPGSAIR